MQRHEGLFQGSQLVRSDGRNVDVGSGIGPSVFRPMQHA